MALETTLTVKGITAPGAPIRVLAWSFGASSSASFIGGGGGAGKPNFQDLSVTKPVDGATMGLLAALATGAHADQAELVVTDTSRQGGTPLRYLLTDVLVTSLSQGGSSDQGQGGPKVPTEQLLTENVSLAYASIAGQGPSGTSFGWNVAGASAL